MVTPEPTEIKRELAIEHGLAAYRKCPNNRAYALDDSGATALGAISAAYTEAKQAAGAKDFSREALASEVIEPLVKLLPALRQDRPAPEPKTPEPWKDKVTGQVAKNPWEEPVDRESQRIVRERDSLLADHMEAIAGGVTYAGLAKLEDEAAERELLGTLSYWEKEHRENVFLGNDILQRSAFVRRAHSAVTAFYKREAETPLRLPIETATGNLTDLMFIAKNNPALREIVKRAHEINLQWINDDLKRLSEAKAQSDAAYEKARSRTNP